MSKIKIVYVVTSCKKSGPIRQTLNIIKYMDRTIFEPYLLTLWNEEENNSILSEYKKTGVIVKCAKLSKARAVVYGLQKVKSILSKIEPDVVQGVGMPPYRMTLGYKNTIHFVTLRNYCYEDYPDYYGRVFGMFLAFFDINLIKKQMRKNEPFVTCSNTLTKMYMEHDNLEIPFIRNGVDVDSYKKIENTNKAMLRSKLGLPQDKMIFVYSGGIIERKNQIEAINAYLSMSKRNESILVLLGDGKDREALETKYGNDINIIFCGEVSNIREYLNASDVYISTSKSEGLPNGVLEAMAGGLPVILSNIPQHLEIFEANNECGYIYDLGNAAALAKCMDDMFMLDLNRIGEQSFNTVMNNFTAEGTSRRYQELYIRLVKRSRKNACI